MQSLNVKLSGLYSFPSDLSAVPEGALAQADNIVIDRDSEAEPRRGFDVLTHGSSVKSKFSDPSYRANKLFFYQSQTLAHYSTNLLAYNDSSSGWTNYSGTYSPPSATVKVRSAQANKNFYFTTSAGVYKLAAYNGTPSTIGAPTGLDLAAAKSSSGNTWLPITSSVAYRLVWGIKDANNNVILGAPTNRLEFTNATGAAIAVDITTSIPSNVTTSHFYQLYRSAVITSLSTPNDELGLVYESSPASGDISAGFITFTDIVPDALRGATIYTAESQEGLANANEPPPYALDLAVFRECLFYGNTTGLQNITVTMLGVGSPNGIQADDTITIDSVVFTAKSSETIASGYFKITAAFTSSGVTASTNSSTSLTSVSDTTGLAIGQLVTGTGIPSGTYVTNIVSSTVTMSQAATASASGVAVTFTGDSAAQAIRDTALSLCKVINRYASSTVYAAYLSGTGDLPGQILLRKRSVGAAAFTVVASRVLSWSPVLPTSGTNANNTSSADAFKNAVFYSKASQPEAVPLGNYIYVGSSDKNILRIIALRDSLFVLKEDGIFRIYGTDPTNFAVSPLDFTSQLIAPDSAVAINNQIYGLSTQGVVAVSETGVAIMSHPIERDLTSLIASNYTTLQQTSFGVAYESSRAYYLFVPTLAADTYPTQYYRYNYITNTWTHSSMSKYCGAVNPVDDKLYLGNTSAEIVDIERKNLTYSDYADYQSTQTISAVSGTLVTLTGSDTIAVGSIVYQSAAVFATVASVDSVAGTVTTTLSSDLAAGSADILAPISCAVGWIPISFQNPGFSKQVREISLLFRADFNGSATVSFASDVTVTAASETISGGNVGGWGLFAWGGPSETALGAYWGGDPRRRPIRVMVPRVHQRGTLLSVTFSHAYGYSPWILQGISAIGSAVSERVAN